VFTKHMFSALRVLEEESITRDYPSADHVMDQCGNSMQLERPAYGTKLVQIMEAGSGNRVDLISESSFTLN